jgi:hypothetical protein
VTYALEANGVDPGDETVPATGQMTLAGDPLADPWLP